MYIGTHYNSYYNSRFVNSSAVYGRMSNIRPNYTPVNLSNSGVYNSLSYDKGAIKAVQDLKSGAADLKSALKDLSSGLAFSQKSYSSSDKESMTVTSASSKYTSTAKMTVAIDQVAKGQVNEGTKLDTKAKFGQAGYHQFSIETNGKSYNFSITVAAGDTNKVIQQKMADAINQKNIGIDAEVVTDSKSNTSALNLSAVKTGADAASRFSIQDISGKAVAMTGAANRTQDAQDAIYRVNGGSAKTSKSNTVDLGNGITATLKKATDQDITVSMTQDIDYAAGKVRDMVSSFNALRSTAMDINDTKSLRLANQLSSQARIHASSMNKIGIAFDSKGVMTIDQDKLNKAAEDGSLEKYFKDSASSYSFTSQLSKLADDIGMNTNNYISKITSDNLFENSLYTNIQNAIQNNKNYSAGMLFNFFM